MKKKVIKDDVFYTLAWSSIQKYDKYSASRTLSVMPGIIGIFYLTPKGYEPLLFFDCWRDGLRDGLKNFMEPTMRFKAVSEQIDKEEVYFNYTIVESSPKDLKDILFWLIRTYRPVYNNVESFADSGRFQNIFVKEIMRSPDDIIEKLP